MSSACYKLCRSFEELQADLDRFVEHYIPSAQSEPLVLRQGAMTDSGRECAPGPDELVAQQGDGQES